MDAWVGDTVKVAAGFLSGLGALWLATRKQLADYENLKRTRRLTGAKSEERTKLAKEHAETLVKLRSHNITHEEFINFSEHVQTGKATAKPAPVEIKRTDEEVFNATRDLEDVDYYWVCKRYLSDDESGKHPLSADSRAQYQAICETIRKRVGDDVVKHGTDYQRGIVHGWGVGIDWMAGIDPCPEDFEDYLGEHTVRVNVTLRTQ